MPEEFECSRCYEEELPLLRQYKGQWLCGECLEEVKDEEAIHEDELHDQSKYE